MGGYIMSFIKATDKRFNYHGRWDRTEDGMMRSHWTAYFEFKIKASSVSFFFDRRTKGYCYDVDGVRMSNVGSGADLTFALDPSKFQTIRITYGNGEFPMYFKGIETDGEIMSAPNKSNYALFIGDSFTTAGTSYARSIIAAKKCDYLFLALTGIALCDGHGTYNENPVGMETAFFHLECPKENVPLTELNTKKLRVPDEIYINIGTGDELENDKNTENFINTYVEFVDKLEKLWPKAKYYILLPAFDSENGLKFSTIEAAAKEITAKWKNAKFIDTREVEIPVANDGVSPTAEGYKVYSEFVLKKLKIKK